MLARALVVIIALVLQIMNKSLVRLKETFLLGFS